jgi:hypothetical protein
MGNQNIKAIKTESWTSIKSVNPIKDGMITDITFI